MWRFQQLFSSGKNMLSLDTYCSVWCKKSIFLKLFCPFSPLWCSDWTVVFCKSVPNFFNVTMCFYNKSCKGNLLFFKYGIIKRGKSTFFKWKEKITHPCPFLWKNRKTFTKSAIPHLASDKSLWSLKPSPPSPTRLPLCSFSHVTSSSLKPRGIKCMCRFFRTSTGWYTTCSGDSESLGLQWPQPRQTRGGK